MQLSGEKKKSNAADSEKLDVGFVASLCTLDCYHCYTNKSGEEKSFRTTRMVLSQNFNRHSTMKPENSSGEAYQTLFKSKCFYFHSGI